MLHAYFIWLLSQQFICALQHMQFHWIQHVHIISDGLLKTYC